MYIILKFNVTKSREVEYEWAVENMCSTAFLLIKCVLTLSKQPLGPLSLVFF